MTKMSTLRLVLPFAALSAIAAGDPSTPESRMNNPQWASRFSAQQAALAQGPFDLVFFGDSITRELDLPGAEPWSDIKVVWQRWFACHRAIELGFAGDTTANLLWRIQNGLVPHTSPKVAVVLIGTNNNRPILGWTAQQTAQGIVSVVTELHRRLPGTQIAVLGVPPNGHGPNINGIIRQVDATLAATDWAPLSARYVPTADLFEQNGQLDTDLFREPHMGKPALHPDAQGWERIAERLMPVIAPLLGVPATPCPGAPAAP